MLVTGLALLLAGCSAEESHLHDPPAAAHRPRPQRFEELLASRSFTAIEWSADGGRALVASSDGGALLYRPPATVPIELLRDAALQPVALLPRGEQILAVEHATTASVSSRLLRIDLTGRRSPVPLPEGEPRFLGWSADLASFLVSVTDAERRAALFELSSSTFTPRLLARYPTEFEISAVSRDARRVVLRRALHPEADELYLDDREQGEMRLLLPDGADARFRPIAFSADSAALLLLSDEGHARLRLEWLDLKSSTRRPLRDGRSESDACEAVNASLSPDGRHIAAEIVCDGSREALLLDAATDSQLAPGPTPMGTVRVAVLSNGEAGPELSTFASSRTPRDLLVTRSAASGSPSAGHEVPRPLTWGLSPGLDPRTLIEARTVALTRAAQQQQLVELWLPASGEEVDSGASSGAVWVESDVAPPNWNEFDPLFQFLATNGIAVARLRFRGSDGFGRGYRHAADGRLLDAALEDLASTVDLLAERGVPRDRIALIGIGLWPGAVATALARGATKIASAAPFSAVIAI